MLICPMFSVVPSSLSTSMFLTPFRQFPLANLKEKLALTLCSSRTPALPLSWPLYQCEGTFTESKKNKRRQSPYGLPLGSWPNHGFPSLPSLEKETWSVFLLFKHCDQKTCKRIVMSWANKCALWTLAPHWYPKKKGKSKVLRFPRIV